MDDPFVTLVDQASTKYFGNAPLHAEPSASVELPSSPSSHQHPKPVKTFDRTRIFPALSSTLSATAIPFKPRTTSPNAQSEGENKRKITYPLAREAFPSNEHLQHFRNVSFQHRLRIDALDRKALSPVQPSQSRDGDGPTMGWQLPPHLLAVDCTERPSSSNVPFTTPSGMSPGQNRRQIAISDGPILHQRLATPRIKSCPSLKLGFQARKAPPKHYELSHSFSSATSPTFKRPLPYSRSLSSFPMPKSHDYHFNPLESNRSSHSQPAETGMLNCVDQGSFQPDQNGDSQSTLFDHYTPTPSNQPAAQSQINPYAQDGSTMGSGAYFQSSANYPQQVCSYSLSNRHLEFTHHLDSFNTISMLHCHLTAKSASRIRGQRGTSSSLKISVRTSLGKAKRVG